MADDDIKALQRLSSRDIAKGIPFSRDALAHACEHLSDHLIDEWVATVDPQEWHALFEDHDYVREICKTPIAQGCIEVLENLAEAGCDFTVPGLLLFISPVNTLETIKFLVKHDAAAGECFSDDRYISTPLHKCIKDGITDTEIFSFLHDAGCNINNNSNKFRYTPLHLCCQFKNVAAALWLIPNVADMDTKNGENLTALHIAARYGITDIVRALLDAGANASLRDLNGRTPFQLLSTEKLAASIMPDPTAKKECLEILSNHNKKKSSKEPKAKRPKKGEPEAMEEEEDAPGMTRSASQDKYTSNVKRKGGIFACVARRKK